MEDAWNPASGYKALTQPTRRLTSSEVEELSRNNTCRDDDWNALQVFSDESFDPSTVRGCNFSGRVVFGKCRLHNSAVETSMIHSGATVWNSNLVNVIVLGQAVIMACPEITCPSSSTFGIGAKVCLEGKPVMVEGRSVSPEEYNSMVEAYARQVAGKYTVIGSGAKLLNSTVTAGLIGSCAVLRSCDVQHSVLLSSEAQPTVVSNFATVHSTIMQSGTFALSGASIDHSFLCSGGGVKHHGKLLNSFLGPLSIVAEGEVSDSLVGPFVGFHHQALLIAANWPEGKGNVGYGANVGSNHTGKAPDQELRSGEGVFFGLGVNIKYPSNFGKAPYTIFASGVGCLPQRIEFPFSLVNTPAEPIVGLSTAINEIIPGWVLAFSSYTVWRNEIKYATRGAARYGVPTAVFRPVIIDMMLAARELLVKGLIKAKELEASGKGFKSHRGGLVLLEQQVPGLGKNFIQTRNLQPAIKAYTDYLKLYVGGNLLQLLGLTQETLPYLGALPAAAPTKASALAQHVLKVFPAVYGDREDMLPWLQRLCLGGLSLSELTMEQQSQLLEVFKDYLAVAVKSTENAAKAKDRDDARGKRTIDSYSVSHQPSSKDSVVIQMRAAVKTREASVAAFEQTISANKSKL